MGLRSFLYMIGLRSAGRRSLSDSFFDVIMDMAALHPFHRQKIDEGTPHPIPGGIFRNAKRSGVVGNGYLNHPKTLHLYQGGHEAVHPLVKFEILKGFPLISSESATAVPDLLFAQSVPDSIRNL